MIPVVAIIMGIGIAMLALYLDYRKKADTLKHYHAERLAAIERGLELPPLPLPVEPPPPPPRDPFERSVVRSRRAGLVLLFIGLSVAGAMFSIGVSAFWFGLIPSAIGLALLISSYLEAREQDKRGGSGP
jgi:hypothetical protein